MLLTLAQKDVAALGPLSIGTPDAGLLVNPLPMPEGPLWTIRNPLETWGTQETIDFVTAAITSVNERFPDTPRVVIGDMSRPDGGRLNRHKSHQVGRDVDVGFYYEAGEADDFQQVRRGQLDLPRTWALVRAILTDTDVDRIFVDRSLISVLYRYAREEEGEDIEWLDDVFGRGERKGIIQHERRHKDHLHVRFFNGVAQEKGRIVYPVLVESGRRRPPDGEARRPPRRHDRPHREPLRVERIGHQGRQRPARHAAAGRPRLPRAGAPRALRRRAGQCAAASAAAAGVDAGVGAGGARARGCRARAGQCRARARGRRPELTRVRRHQARTPVDAGPRRPVASPRDLR